MIAFELQQIVLPEGKVVHSSLGDDVVKTPGTIITVIKCTGQEDTKVFVHEAN